MFDALFADEAERNLAERVRRPGLIPSPNLSAFTGFGEALRAALPAAATESTRALSPLLDAYGKAAAFTFGAAQEDSIDRMGDKDLSPLLGRELKKLAPDPNATGVAAQIVFGVGKLVGKAAGYSMLAGPYGGAVLTGADEGANEMLKLTDQGVDTTTALKAGAVRGAVTAVNVALPLAGKTLTQTAGLALAGGPLSFMGEQAAIQAILQHADYAQAAQAYDPFDPVGLTVSTVAPFLFGAAAHAVRARGAKAPGADIDTPAPHVSPEQVDAALTLNRAHQVDAVSLAPRDDFAARNAHVDALEAAGRSLDSGRAVDLDLPAHLDAERAAQAATLIKEAAPAIEARAAAHAPLDDLGDLGTPARASAEPHAGPDTAAAPDVELARQIVAEHPDMPIYTGAFDEQGRPVAASAAELWAKVETDLLDANLDRKAFNAAINCFLGHP
jgi:hypothetical protein